MLIAQISDTHIDKPGVLAFGRYDTQKAFARALEKIASEAQRPDLLLHTGDVTQHGDLAVYQRARAMLDATGIPYALMAGNHENAQALRTAFAEADWMPGGPFLQYVIDRFPVRLICLDTTIEGKMEGELCRERLDWLASRLAQEPAKPTMIAMHHPAFRIGSRALPPVNFRNEREFADLVSRYPNVSLIVAGHVHCTLQARIGQAVALTVPSTAFQFAIERTAGKRAALIDEPAGYCLHRWESDGGFTSQLVLVGDFAVTDFPRG
jgi:3',5'-cyclic AMP phosphodiesterase CpdA